MVASRIHLVRHGEVANPGKVLYGRLPGFGLSDRGKQMAARAADELGAQDRQITRILSSPLERAQESAQPISERYGVPIETKDGLIEAMSHLEGGQFQMDLSILAKPKAWRYLVNPMKPSWGEPFREVAARIRAEMDEAWESTESGDVAIVSHQLPIWMAHRFVAKKPLFHDPRARRCALSSITSFERAQGDWIEVGYVSPAQELIDAKRDTGAV
ncbi:histidine phosphatase family protein [Naasia sp. SYSU D00057]|uniref:histidine phosphatase family protein n=1 Tax=Naasia sp. SYSU D00057 TaxID=2817380 RepID=UPI001B3181D9|nr:histidine phosphatase family protein [Naasia sp. SYSU D00057]